MTKIYKNASSRPAPCAENIDLVFYGKNNEFWWEKYRSDFWIEKLWMFEWEKYRSGFWIEKLWILNEKITNLYFRCEKQWLLNEKNIDMVLDVKNNEFWIKKIEIWF